MINRSNLAFQQPAHEDLPASEGPVPRLQWANGPQGGPGPADEDASLLPGYQDDQ